MQPWTRRAALGGVVTAGAIATSSRAVGLGDVAVLRRAYAELHPGLLRYSTAAEVSARFDRLERDFDTAADPGARYLTLSRFLATVRCGHTYANFYNQSKAVQGALFSAKDRLPFHFLWLGGRMVVTADPTGCGLSPGDEVTAIDGRPAGRILAALMTVARADGANDGKRRRLVSMQAEDGFETFDVFYPLMFGGRDRYRLTVRDIRGRLRAVEAPAIGLEERRAQRKAAPFDDGPVWTLRRDGAVAILTMPTWALYNSKWDWKAWLSKQFEELDRTGARGLVVDLRGNEGGQDCGDEILAHLIDAPLQVRDSRRLVRYRKTPDDLKAVLDTWDPSFRNWGDEARPFDSRFYELVQKEDDGRAVGEVRPAGPRFRGKVAVLIDAQNSSATHQFADSVRRNRLGVLVGQETGGNQRGINGGAFFFLRLRESGLEADLPVIGAFPRTPRPDRGVVPDLFAAPTPQSLAVAQDPAISRAIGAARG